MQNIASGKTPADRSSRFPTVSNSIAVPNYFVDSVQMATPLGGSSFDS
jgi:hypothetical protein